MWRLWPVVLVLAACGGGDATPPAPTTKPTKSASPTSPTGQVTIEGSVIDQATGEGVREMIVTLRDASGDVRRETANDGTFSFVVAPGTYSIFVEDKNTRLVMIGLQNRLRLDAGPRPELAQIDDGLLPTLVATSDVRELELAVTPGAIVTGYVFGANDNKVRDAVVRLRALDRSLFEVRPMLGTDIAAVDENSHFRLLVPPGRYVLEGYHPDYAGSELVTMTLAPGQQVGDINITMTRGCIITGRVVDAAGRPAHDGAIERHDGTRFGPSGRIDAGGEFRWTTMVTDDITLRAWPWQSPPSQAKTFHCRDGKRYDKVVLRIPSGKPDLRGVIVDAHGNPVPLVFVDVQPLDPVPVQLGASQQERSDSLGAWEVYDVPPGRYRITATAPERGVVEATVTAPKQDVRLQLTGSGRIAGTTTDLVNGSFLVSFLHCGPKQDPLAVAHESRLVVVRGGTFSIENAPACALTLAVRWRDQVREAHVVVEPERTAYLELDLGAPRDKTVHGTVRDRSGKPIANARVTAVIEEHEVETVRCDRNGRYTLKTRSGAQLVAGDGAHVGRATVGRANVPSEQLDITLDDADQ